MNSYHHVWNYNLTEEKAEMLGFTRNGNGSENFWEKICVTPMRTDYIKVI